MQLGQLVGARGPATGEGAALATWVRRRYLGRMNTAQKLLDEALQLDEAERGSMALELMDSLSLPDARDDAAWIEEIERRARGALSGGSAGTDADERVR